MIQRVEEKSVIHDGFIDILTWKRSRPEKEETKRDTQPEIRLYAVKIVNFS